MHDGEIRYLGRWLRGMGKEGERESFWNFGSIHGVGCMHGCSDGRRG